CSFLADHVRAIGASLSLGLVWLFHVFTVHGLLVSLGVESGDDLTAPWATRIVWWVLFYAAGSAWVQRLMWREAVLSFTSHPQLWAASHVDAAKRVGRRVVWWKAGIGSALAQFRRHRVPMSWWRRLVTVGVPAVPDVSRPVSEPADAVPAAA
ncbi:MAG: hypothetical protein JWM47_2189, partial [Acidimicrobiales bacterium]|nr:hypothetical protein [Acidimicrobiales bacterium]